MAFNVQIFKTRALSALVFVAFMLAGLFINQWSFLLLFLVVHIGCWLEYAQLVQKIDSGYQDVTSFHRYGVIITGMGFMLWQTADSLTLGGITLQQLGWFILLIGVITLPVAEIVLSKKPAPKNMGHAVFGWLYISLSLGLLIQLTHVQLVHTYTGAAVVYTLPATLIPLFILLCMWVNDTMAYLVGSFIGKTPFSAISPKKTWEGTIGGAVLCVLVMGFAAPWLSRALFNASLNEIIANYHWFVLAAIAAITGTAGDLLESKLKRMANVKDSGNMMPGHGGFLDRFDSLLVATPFVWLYICLFI
jgi:phosphatidate cytidylyltransferase